MSDLKIHMVNVFGAGPGGGNPAPIVLGAAGMTDDAMRSIALQYGHESAFVLPAPAGSDADIQLRFWVPNHEMSMCGHATVGTVWLLDRLGHLGKERLRIHTLSGPVIAVIANAGTEARAVEISQPTGQVEPIEDATLRAELASVLGISMAAFGSDPIQNAWTSRVKTLIPIRSVADLDGLRPDFGRVRELCNRVGSTGLYPYARNLETGIVDARQFPQSSGYPEDPATGIAAAALAFGLLRTGALDDDKAPLCVRQGRAMGRPSEITIRLERDGDAVTGCWIGGAVHEMGA
ncbi:MAG: phenazine biosynthesis protein PhzF [Bradyrhizobium sp.]|nr:phenazine biosynthesis protein PhzF [Bradyrhizobium sp.]